MRKNATALKNWWKQINEWRDRKCLGYATSDLVIKPLRETGRIAAQVREALGIPA